MTGTGTPKMSWRETMRVFCGITAIITAIIIAFALLMALVIFVNIKIDESQANRPASRYQLAHISSLVEEYPALQITVCEAAEDGEIVQREVDAIRAEYDRLDYVHHFNTLASPCGDD